MGTDGTLGGKFETATALAELIAAQWPAGAGHRLVVLTGGEPLLQVDRELIDALHAQQFGRQVVLLARRVREGQGF